MRLTTTFYWQHGDDWHPDEEIPVKIEFDISPFIPAKLYGPPELCHPSEGGEIEIVSLEIPEQSLSRDSFGGWVKSYSMASMAAERFMARYETDPDFAERVDEVLIEAYANHEADRAEY